MAWLIIALGLAFVVYLLYCYVQEWRAKRRIERIRRESRAKAVSEFTSGNDSDKNE